MKKPLILIVLFFFLFQPSVWQTAWGAPAAKTGAGGAKLVIGTKEAVPFSMKDAQGNWQGVSIELWRDLAEDLQLDYEFKEYDLPGLLQALETSQIDAAVAALTITAEREKLFDFTHPFYNSGLGIAVNTKHKSHWLVVLDRLLSPAFLKAIASLALLLLVVGFLVYLFERRRNEEHFGGGVMQGIGSGFWWSAVTMTTVGYGDKAPKTLGGRIVGILWMFIAIIVISSFTAAITSALTVSQISTVVQGPEDLKRVRVATLEHSTSAGYLKRERIRFQSYADIKEALKALQNEQVDAVVYDEPMLRYQVTNETHGSVSVLPVVFDKQHYGIGLPAGSPLRERLNRAILNNLSTDKWKDLLYQYLGT